VSTTTQPGSTLRVGLESDAWNGALLGKTIRGVRPTHDSGPVPEVVMLFTDGTTAKISVLDEVYFEACLINTLRKAQAVADVTVDTDFAGSHTIEIRSKTFPLVVLRAVNKGRPVEDFPFRLEWVSA
jgi:hypothetical protein